MTTSTAHRHQKLTTEEEIEYLHEQLQNLYEYSSAIGGKVSDLSSTLSQWCLSSQLLNSNYDHLKEEFIRISKLVYEANTMLEEMHQQIVYRVILQISVSYLKPAERVCFSFSYCVFFLNKLNINTLSLSGIYVYLLFKLNVKIQYHKYGILKNLNYNINV